MAVQGNDAFLSEKLPQDIEASICIISTHWNREYCDKLNEGATKILSNFKGVTINALSVPGAIELGHAVSSHSKKHRADAYIIFGCVIQGETPHFDFVCRSVTDSCTELNLKLESPVVFGVLTCDNEQQVIDRLGGAHGHKGEEAAWTALQMIQFKRSL